jgi:hypothetical protein
MKEKVIKTYTIEELKEQFPDGYQQAWDAYCNSGYDDVELFASDTLAEIVNFAEKVGITFNTRVRVGRTNNGKPVYDEDYYYDTDMNYRYFVFNGYYHPSEAKLNTLEDWEKLEFVDILDAIAKADFTNDDRITRDICFAMNYRHHGGSSMSMDVTLEDYDNEFDDIIDDLEDKARNIINALENLVLTKLQANYEYCQSDEYFEEQCMCNEWMFNEQGGLE